MPISSHNKLLKIAHITPHVGGGVGAVLESFFTNCSENIENSLFCLDKCETNFDSIKNTKYKSNALAFTGKKPTWTDDLIHFDIILIHYWNHPLLADFLASNQIPPSRRVIWCHNSGLQQPHIIPNYIGRIASSLVFSSTCSFQAPNIDSLKHQSKGNLHCIHSTRCLEAFHEINLERKSRQPSKVLLYTGTVSKNKMHPHAAHIFAKLSLQGFQIHVVGGPNHDLFEKEVAKLGGTIFTHGPINDLRPFYRNADIFVYPLKHDHYGTGEQVILEALASGLPVISFANPAEKAILHGGGGILVSSPEEFIEATVLLTQTPNKLVALSKIANSRAITEFNSKLMTNKLLSICYKQLKLNKSPYFSPIETNCKLNKIALYALNSFFDERIFNGILTSPDQSVDLIFSLLKHYLLSTNNKSSWIGKNKSTPEQYLRYSPDSSELKELVDKINTYLSYSPGHT